MVCVSPMVTHHLVQPQSFIRCDGCILILGIDRYCVVMVECPFTSVLLRREGGIHLPRQNHRNRLLQPRPRPRPHIPWPWLGLFYPDHTSRFIPPYLLYLRTTHTHTYTVPCLTPIKRSSLSSCHWTASYPPTNRSCHWTASHEPSPATIWSLILLPPYSCSSYPTNPGSPPSTRPFYTVHFSTLLSFARPAVCLPRSSCLGRPRRSLANAAQSCCWSRLH